MNRLVIAGVTLLAALWLSPVSHAQCPAAWAPIAAAPTTIGLAGSLALPGGDFIVAGGFSIAGSSNIARYNPTTNTWSGLGSGVNSGVNAMALTPGGDLIAAGDFTTAGGAPANRIARCNLTTGAWTTLGTGTNNIIYAVAVVPGGDIIAGGTFTTAGGIAVNRIARYNPATNLWSAMGSGVVGGSGTPVINAMVSLPGGDVMVAGDFFSAGGVGSGSIARYNPATGAWSTPGAGPGGVSISSLALLPGGDLITGGSSAFAGGGPGTLIARCNLATNVWTGLGSYTSGFTTGLTVLPSGDLIAWGTWTIAAGLTANHIIKCNPSTNTWTTLGSGVAGGGPAASVGGVAVLSSGDLLVTGRFATAGGIAASNIARYSFGSPAPSITSQPNSATICPSDTASFSITASGASPVYQWQWQPAGPNTAWAALANGINLSSQGSPAFDVSGATTPTTNIRSIWGLGGNLRCIVTSAGGCGTATSNQATLTINPCSIACSVADIVAIGGSPPPDGLLTGDDFNAFIASFASGDPLADIVSIGGVPPPDGLITGDDFNAFISAFAAGCP